jgi:type IV pilus assembly protein PilY1
VPIGYEWAYGTQAATNYTPPSQAKSGCAKNFIIFLGNKFPAGVGSAADLTDAAALVGQTADTNQTVSISPKNPYADEWARFMKTYGVPVDSSVTSANSSAAAWNNITTYTIDNCVPAEEGGSGNSLCDTPQGTLLKSMAKVGGGKYFNASSKAKLKNALALIFAEIQAVNSVFASATLPISVNTQGTYENQV